MTHSLAIYQCPEHKNFWSVCLDKEDGGGTRMTPSKCCGRWSLVRRWGITKEQLKELSDMFLVASEE